MDIDGKRKLVTFVILVSWLWRFGYGTDAFLAKKIRVTDKIQLKKESSSNGYGST